jgi:hypothetical protein
MTLRLFAPRLGFANFVSVSRQLATGAQHRRALYSSSDRRLNDDVVLSRCRSATKRLPAAFAKLAQSNDVHLSWSRETPTHSP